MILKGFAIRCESLLEKPLQAFSNLFVLRVLGRTLNSRVAN